MVKELETTLICTVTFPANQAANVPTQVSFTIDPSLPAVSQFQIPNNESWVIDDVYVTGSQSVDAIVTFVKNFLEVMTKTSPINSLLVSNPSRPRVAPVVYAPTEIMTIQAQNLAAIGTSAVTDTFYVKVKRFVE